MDCGGFVSACDTWGPVGGHLPAFGPWRIGQRVEGVRTKALTKEGGGYRGARSYVFALADEAPWIASAQYGSRAPCSCEVATIVDLRGEGVQCCRLFFCFASPLSVVVVSFRLCLCRHFSFNQAI